MLFDALVTSKFRAPIFFADDCFSKLLFAMWVAATVVSFRKMEPAELLVLTDKEHRDTSRKEDDDVVCFSPLLGPGVHNDGDHSLQEGELGPESQGKQHREEEESPNLGSREQRHSLRVDHESQTRTWKFKYCR